MIHVHGNKKNSSLPEDNASEEPNKGAKNKQDSAWFTGKKVI